MESELPRAIQAQLDEAEAIEKQLAGQNTAPEGNTDVAIPEPAETKSEPVQEPPEPEAHPQVAESDPWERRYRVLQSKYDAEVPRLHAQNRELYQQVAAVQQQVEALGTPAKTPAQSVLVTDSDKESFGEDLVDLMDRVARQHTDRYEAELASLRAKLAAVDTASSHVAAQQAESVNDRFWSEVAKQIPDWGDVDSNPDWVSWLDSRAVGSKSTYRQLAESAIQGRDATPIAELVSLWKQHMGVPVNAHRTPNPPKELQRQVSPSKSRTSTAPATERAWTWSEYERAYDPRLSLTMTAAEIEQLQSDAEKAVRDNRIR